VYILTGARQSGKTEILVRMVQDDERGILIAHSEQEASRIRDKYKLDHNKVISVGTVKKETRGRQYFPPNFYVDNMDMVMGYLLEGHISAGSATGVGFHSGYVHD
jgi:hypothetical protein